MVTKEDFTDVEFNELCEAFMVTTQTAAGLASLADLMDLSEDYLINNLRDKVKRYMSPVAGNGTAKEIAYYYGRAFGDSDKAKEELKVLGHDWTPEIEAAYDCGCFDNCRKGVS